MKTSYFIPQQVPQFVLAEYPAFVEFLQAYYDWYNEQPLGSLQTLTDIDTTVDSFIRYFKKELDESGVLNDNNRFYLRNLKQLYKAKGSKASFKFLFKLLYDLDSEIEHPWDYTFKTSDGRWKQDSSTIVRVDKGNGHLLGGNYIHIIDVNGKYYNTYVHDVVKRAEDVFELFIDRFECGRVRFAQIKTLDNSITGTILLSTVKATVENPGEGFEVGQIFNISSIGGSGTVVKIKDVDNKGSIKTVEIVSFGYGYRHDFNTAISSKQNIKPAYNLFLTLTDNEDNKIGEFNYKTNGQPNVQRERGEFVRHIYSNLTNEKFDYIRLNENIASLFQEDLEIIGQTSNATAIIKRYSNMEQLDDVIFIKDITGVFQVGETIKCGNVVATVKDFLVANFFEDGTYVGDLLGGFLVDEPLSDPENFALIKFNVGCILQYPGYYLDGTNLLDNLIYIHDSHYYQIYSYVTVVEESVAKYGNVIKQLLHPSGTAHFGRLKLSNDFTLSVQAALALNLLDIPDVWRSTVRCKTTDLLFDIEKVPISTVNTSSLWEYRADYIRDMMDLNPDTNEYLVQTSDDTEKSLTREAFQDDVSIGERGVQTVEQIVDDKIVSIKILDADGNIVFNIYPGVLLYSNASTTDNLEFGIDFELNDIIEPISTFEYNWLYKEISLQTDVTTVIDSLELQPILLPVHGVGVRETSVSYYVRKNVTTININVVDQLSFKLTREINNFVTTSNIVNMEKNPVYSSPIGVWTTIGYQQTPTGEWASAGYLENEYTSTN